VSGPGVVARQSHDVGSGGATIQSGYHSTTLGVFVT
jgi:hypothetical protein